MFRVIVLGGVALVGGCGGTVDTSTKDAGYPSELGPPAVDASSDTGPDVGFPSELPAQVDSGPPIVDAGKEGG